MGERSHIHALYSAKISTWKKSRNIKMIGGILSHLVRKLLLFFNVFHFSIILFRPVPCIALVLKLEMARLIDPLISLQREEYLPQVPSQEYAIHTAHIVSYPATMSRRSSWSNGRPTVPCRKMEWNTKQIPKNPRAWSFVLSMLEEVWFFVRVVDPLRVQRRRQCRHVLICVTSRSRRRQWRSTVEIWK